jgi:uncharacterized protein (DUF58 family)
VASALEDVPPAEHRLIFRATPRLLRLGLVAGVAVAVAVATGHPDVLALAAGPLVLLAAGSADRLPRTALVRWRFDPDRCVEDEQVELALVVRTDGALGALHAEPIRDVTLHLGRAASERLDSRTVSTTWAVTPDQWGRARLGPGTVTVEGPLGLYAARLDVGHRELVVYPGSAHVSRVAAPTELPARLGEHPTRAVGSGVEFRGVRPYLPGDRRRDIDWRTSARHGSLFVRQYSAERAMDLVLVLDVGTGAGGAQHVGPRGRSALDLAVRGATGLALAYLAHQDRVGVVALGGSVRWLAPDRGVRQLYRIAEAVMEARIDDSMVRPGLERVPPQTLPRAAVVVLFSPLLEGRVLDVVRDLRARGSSVIVVDTLTVAPTGGPSATSQVAVRIWRLGRQVSRFELSGLGVPVLPWDGEGDLGAAVLHALRPLRPEVRA